jgi:hypothetical protein
VDGGVFHRATNLGIEGGTTDQGGAVFVFVRNTGTTPQTFTSASVSFNGAAVGSHASHDWTRIWPLTIGPGETTTLTIKGAGAPFVEGGAAAINLTADSGQSVAANFALATPKLRIGNVIPSQDLTKSFVYLRNDDTVSYQLDNLFLNENVTSASRFVGGQSIAPNSVKIIEVDHGAPQKLLRPLAARVEARRSDNNQSVLTGAPVRLTEPVLPTGTWGSELRARETNIETARLQYGHTMHITSQFPRLLDSRARNHFIQGLQTDILDFPEPTPNNWDLNTVQALGQQAPLFSLPPSVAAEANNPSIYAWVLEDEPDLRRTQANRNPQAMWRLNETYWRNSDKATHLNLVADNHVQRYGLISDHPAIDHYMQYAPLNYGGVFTTYPIDEALAYAESMKDNVEPLRMWWTTQGVSPGTWGTQPTDWGIAVQFWSAIMGGSKGLVGFKYSDVEASFPTQHARQEALHAELQNVSGLVLYGETLDNVTINKPRADVQARSIISEQGVVVPVVNLTGEQRTVFGVKQTPTFSTLSNVVVNVAVPDWINIDQVRRVTAGGYTDNVNFTRSGQNVSITIDQLRDTDVFLISKADQAAPERVTSLRLARRDPQDPNYVPTPAGMDFLSWGESFDDFGVLGYRVFEDGVQIGDVPTPAFNSLTFNPAKQYTVQAYDAAGNLAPLSNTIGGLPAPQSGPFGNRVVFRPNTANRFEVYNRPSGTNWGSSVVAQTSWGGVGASAFVADINGDGIDDVVSVTQVSSPEGDRWRYSTSYSHSQPGVMLPGSAGVVETLTGFATSDGAVQFGDIDGDGIDDPTAVRAGVAGLVWTSFLSAGKVGFADPSRGAATIVGELFGVSGLDTPLLGDINGDGVDDRIIHRLWTNGTGATAREVFVDFSEAGSFGDGIIDAETVIAVGTDGVAVSDVNGDGYDDLVAIRAGTRFQTYAYYTSASGLPPTNGFAAPNLSDFGGLGSPGAGDRLLFGSFGKAVRIAGDFNSDGLVDAADYTLWRDNLGQTVPAGTSADGDRDGMVGPNDFNIWRATYGLYSASATAVPESSSWGLLSCTFAVLWLHRLRVGRKVADRTDDDRPHGGPQHPVNRQLLKANLDGVNRSGHGDRDEAHHPAEKDVKGERQTRRLR